MTWLNSEGEYILLLIYMKSNINKVNTYLFKALYSLPCCFILLSLKSFDVLLVLIQENYQPDIGTLIWVS